VKKLALLLMLVIGSAAFAAEPRVTLQMKDADVRDVLKALQQQCGIRNLVIDPDVQGKGACLILKKVPCSTAFRVVFRQFDLTGQVDANVTTVEKRKD
jgi:type II secretory pathway component GspD/PulD (secretin)